jgi:hypothetical protein
MVSQRHKRNERAAAKNRFISVAAVFCVIYSLMLCALLLLLTRIKIEREQKIVSRKQMAQIFIVEFLSFNDDQKL